MGPRRGFQKITTLSRATGGAAGPKPEELRRRVLIGWFGFLGSTKAIPMSLKPLSSPSVLRAGGKDSLKDVECVVGPTHVGQRQGIGFQQINRGVQRGALDAGFQHA